MKQKVATMLKTRLSIALLVFGCLLLPHTAQAADVPNTATSVGNPSARIEPLWKFVIAPYLLLPTIQGDAEIGRLPSTSLDVSPGSIFENLHFGFMGHFEALYDNRFGATFDVAYMDLGKGTSFPQIGGSVDVGVKQLITEGFFGYRFWRQNESWAETYIGGRWWYNQLEVTARVPGNRFSRTIDEHWIDPVLGLRGQVFLTPQWSLYGSGNVGGFGLVSNFTWGLKGGVGYHFNDSIALHLQYKAIGVDYDNDKSGRSRFTYDTVTHGPLLGVALAF